MLPQTYTTRIGALEQRIAVLRRLTMLAALLAAALPAAIPLFVPTGTGFALGFEGKVLLPLRLLTGDVPIGFQNANPSLFNRSQGMVVMTLINFIFLGGLTDWLRRAANLTGWQALALRVLGSVAGAVIVATPWIMVAGLTAWVAQKRIRGGARPGGRTWFTSLLQVLFGLLFIAPPFMTMLLSFAGGMDFSAQSAGKTIYPFEVSRLPPDQEDAIGADQLHYVRAQAAWLQHRPAAMTKELAQITGAWHPPLLVDRTRLGFMMRMAGTGLSARQITVLEAVGADDSSYLLARNARIVLGVLGMISAGCAAWLALVLARRSRAMQTFVATIEPARSRMIRPAGDYAPAL